MFPITKRDWLNKIEGKQPEVEKNKYEGISKSPNLEWWTPSYLDWFFYNVYKLGEAFNNTGTIGSNSFLRTKDINDLFIIEDFERDRLGKGHIFVPGVILLTVFTEAENSGFHKRKAKELEGIIKTPYQGIFEISSLSKSFPLKDLIE